MLEVVKQKFNGADRADFLVGVANKLLALGQMTEAKSALNEALALDGKAAAALVHRLQSLRGQSVAACVVTVDETKRLAPYVS